MSGNRVDRLNSLLKEVIAEVIRKEVKHPEVHPLMTITRVDITRDLHYAKVYVSVLGSPEEKQKTLQALQSAAGYIAVLSSKEVVMRYFPELTFKLDEGVDKHMRIDALLEEVQKERENRSPKGNNSPSGSQ